LTREALACALVPDVPTTVAFPDPLPAERDGDGWSLDCDDRRLRFSNLDKVYWPDDGFTKGDLVTYYWNAARWALPYVRDRALTMKRMPDGLSGQPFYAKQAPGHTPDWVVTAAVTSLEDGKTIDYVLGQDRPTLLWLANLGCIELHPWHSRVDAIGRPDYAFFDLDPFDVDFATVRAVALVVQAALAHLGLRGYPRTSGATGMQVYVPIDRVHSAAAVRAFVRQVCRSIHAADRGRTTMAPRIADRSGRVYLDYGMNTEGRNIAATYSLRPEAGAPVATPLTWDEVDSDVEPRDFTMRTIWARLGRHGDLFAPVLDGGQDLRGALEVLGLDSQASERPAAHAVGRVGPRGDPDAADAPEADADDRLAAYTAKRDFERTPEPPSGLPAASPGRRFVIQHHLARRLHHDLRLEREGVAVSWAVPKGLPDVPGRRRLAVQTEDHPIEYMTFAGRIPDGEYGGGEVRIWDEGVYEASEWTGDKVTFRLQGRRHRGEYHLVRTDGDQWLVVRRDAPLGGELPAEPPTYRPMLASAEPVALDDPDWLYEVKWDGVRVLATVHRPGERDDGSTALVSRQGNDVTAGYPELANLWERVIARNAVLDGEIIATDEQGRPSFQRLQRRMHLREQGSVEQARKRVPIQLVVFDLLFVDGEELIALPLTERLARLDAVLVPGSAVQRSTTWAGDGVALFEAVKERGLEGLLAKRAAGRYQPGRRSRDWAKIKVRREADVVVGGWLPGEGGRRGRLGALLVGAYGDDGLHYLGRVGTGFSDATLEQLEGLLAERGRDAAPFVDAPALPGPRWVEPDLVARVEYGELTDERRLRAPAYKRLRDDVVPDDCRLDRVG
jgi:bifunctional non-homologous end joining protein LigD